MTAEIASPCRPRDRKNAHVEILLVNAKAAVFQTNKLQISERPPYDKYVTMVHIKLSDPRGRVTICLCSIVSVSRLLSNSATPVSNSVLVLSQ